MKESSGNIPSRFTTAQGKAEQLSVTSLHNSPMKESSSGKPSGFVTVQGG